MTQEELRLALTTGLGCMIFIAFSVGVYLGWTKGLVYFASH